MDLTLSYKGQRQLKVLDFSVEWYNLEHIPLIELHFLTNRSPPLISQPVPKCRLTASPRGKPRAVTFNFHHSMNRSVTQPFGRLIAAPTGYVQNQGHVAFIERHPLSQPVRAASSPRGGAEGASRHGGISIADIPKDRVGGADSLSPRPLTPPCVPFGTRRFPSLRCYFKVAVEKECISGFPQSFF